MNRLVCSAFFAFLFLGALVVNASGQAAPGEPVSAAAAAPQAAEEARGPQAGDRVKAEVILLRYRAAEIWLDNGDTLVPSGVELRVFDPEGFGKTLNVLSFGHPHIGTRPLLLGSYVTFVLPKNWEHGTVFLDDLKELAFVK
ncbi:MAG TPA: hypothetical protein VJ725_31025 [Thermoanaerobaculia bacterium]|nr:hypothetical protein [Thermoanaerobaculia bacterium]